MFARHVSRRRLLATGAAGAFLPALPLRAFAGSAASGAAPLTGAPGTSDLDTSALLAWLVVSEADGARLTLARFDRAGIPLDVRDLAIPASTEGLHAACGGASDLAVAAMARQWRVPAASCSVVGGRIVHADGNGGTGRSVKFDVWVDVA